MLLFIILRGLIFKTLIINLNFLIIILFNLFIIFIFIIIKFILLYKSYILLKTFIKYINILNKLLIYLYYNKLYITYLKPSSLFLYIKFFFKII